MTAPAGTTVSVRVRLRRPVLSAGVSLAVGQAFQIAVVSGATVSTYHVRCIPEDFPVMTREKNGTTQAEYYYVALPFSRMA